MLIRASICCCFGLARLAELGYSRRNSRHFSHSSTGRWSRRTFPLVVLVHASVIAGTFVFGSRRPRLPFLLVLFLVQPIRAWVLLTLGDRWNAHGAVAPDMVVATSGPYALVRHPNYSVVVLELASLPAAFRLDRLAAIAGLVNAALLAVRIYEEERLLFDLPGYRQHFASKPRFLPFLF